VEEPKMPDVTSSSFGMLIAYLLPGLSMFYSLALCFPPVRNIFNTFLTAESNVGLFLLVLLGSIVISLELAALRWLLYEKIICRSHKLNREKFKNLKSKETLDAFRAAVDEHYRYHQFWGALSLVLPTFAVCLDNGTSLTTPMRVLLYSTSLAAAVITLFVARDAFIKYTERANAIIA
jgi:hypothetical protein